MSILATNFTLWAPLIYDDIFMTKLQLFMNNVSKWLPGSFLWRSWHFWPPCPWRQFHDKVATLFRYCLKAFSRAIIILNWTFFQQSWHFEAILFIITFSWQSCNFLCIMLQSSYQGHSCNKVDTSAPPLSMKTISLQSCNFVSILPTSVSFGYCFILLNWSFFQQSCHTLSPSCLWRCFHD